LAVIDDMAALPHYCADLVINQNVYAEDLSARLLVRFIHEPSAGCALCYTTVGIRELSRRQARSASAGPAGPGYDGRCRSAERDAQGARRPA
jgi:hypothetical protein